MSDTWLDKVVGLSENEARTRLEKIFPPNNSGVVLFAARCALRVFPLIAVKGDLDLWPYPHNINNLLAVWRALLSSWLNQEVSAYKCSRIVDPVPRAVFETVDDAASAVNSSYLIQKAVSASVKSNKAYRSILSGTSNKGSGYALAMSRMRRPAYYDKLDKQAKASDISQQQDILYLESNESLIDKPLFLNEVSLIREFDVVVSNIFPQAINKIIGEKSKKKEEVIQLLEGIHPLYMRLYVGSAKRSEVESEVERLDSHLNLIDVKKDEVESENDIETLEVLDDIVDYEERDGEEQNLELKTSSSAQNPKDLEHNATIHHNSHQASTVDYLNRDRLVDTLAAILAAPNNHHHQTIGLLGHWGIGKSTVINLLKERLLKDHQEQPFLFAEFNAWEYEHTDNLQAGIAQEMIKALSSPKEIYIPPASTDAIQEEKIARHIASEEDKQNKEAWFFKRPFFICRFAIAMHPWRILGLLFAILISVSPLFFSDVIKPILDNIPGGDKGIPQVLWVGGFLLYFYKQLKSIFASPMAKELFTYLKLPDYGEHLGAIPVMRKHIKIMSEIRLNQTNKTKKRLLYVVDDLDRCSPKGIVKVLEAVRLVLDLDQVMVIVAVDQRIALSALALHYEDLAKYHSSRNPKNIARDYLAKMIHLPITLSEPDKDSVGAYLDKLWEQTHDEAPDNGEAKEGSIQEGEGESPHLNNDQGLDHYSNEGISGNTENKADIVNTSPDLSPTSEIEPDVDEDLTNNKGTDINKPLGASEIPDDIQATLPVGMSEQQQKAFKHWLNHFGLTNPRQVKRLDNGYNLIRQFYDEDKTPPERASPEAEGKKAYLRHYPLLLTLFTLEYINNNDDIANRKRIKDILLGHVTNNGEDPKVTEELVGLVNQPLTDQSIHLVHAVEPFVLPAIENEDIEEENKFAQLKAIRQKLDDVRSQYR